MRKALIVGIDDYKEISSLSGCVNDALAVASILERNGDGSPNFSTKTLTSNNGEVNCSILIDKPGILVPRQCRYRSSLFCGTWSD